MEIDGIVTKPVDFDGPHKVPFLLNPHGGPTGASLLSFSPTEQIMARERVYGTAAEFSRVNGTRRKI